MNLALHVTGRRGDGYHLLDSLVVFADVGDWIDIRASREIALSVSGPARRRRSHPTAATSCGARRKPSARTAARTIRLDKHLPHAGGIGGGSADAGRVARAGRAVARAASRPDALLDIGADIPVCAASAPARMRGIGDMLDPVPPIPPLWLVLANPG